MLRKDPAAFHAHIEGLLETVHTKMMAPFRTQPPTHYAQFPKAPRVDLSLLVEMPDAVHTAPDKTASVPHPPVTQSESPPPVQAHPPTPNPPSLDKGVLIASAPPATPRGIRVDGVPEMMPEDALHTETVSVPASGFMPDTPELSVSKGEPPVVPPKTPKEADADAVKKRFEARQTKLDDLLKRKGDLT